MHMLLVFLLDSFLHHGFQDVPVEFVKSGNGWSWAESEGDNTQYTERIAAHWYWYEAKF